MTTDPDIYFRARNAPAFLATKLVYNTAAAIVGGLVAARLARRAPMAHGLVLAVIQTVAFGWALVTPALRRSTPDWMWALFDRCDIRRHHDWLALDDVREALRSGAL
ncbi:MAG TPA: hypothetical protein VHI98_05975 [Vicinamibacterales bacterium]|nr:hypothetical protein [Vicinamibacterales bacterium]